jgi:hypothetical protein
MYIYIHVYIYIHTYECTCTHSTYRCMVATVPRRQAGFISVCYCARPVVDVPGVAGHSLESCLWWWWGQWPENNGIYLSIMGYQWISSIIHRYIYRYIIYKNLSYNRENYQSCFFWGDIIYLSHRVETIGCFGMGFRPFLNPWAMAVFQGSLTYHNMAARVAVSPWWFCRQMGYKWGKHINT